MRRIAIVLVSLVLAGCSTKNHYKDPTGSSLPIGEAETVGRNVSINVVGTTLQFDLRACVDSNGEVWGLVASDSYPDGHAPETEDWTWRRLPVSMAQGSISTGDETLTWLDLSKWGFVDGQVDKAELKKGKIVVTIPGADTCTVARVSITS